MHGARPNDQQESVISTGKDVDDLVAMARNRLGAASRKRQFVSDLLWSRDGTKGQDPPIGGAVDGAGATGDGRDVYRASCE
jgi:hypothetical protein